MRDKDGDNQEPVHGKIDSLSQTIKTQEAADRFMNELRALNVKLDPTQDDNQQYPDWKEIIEAWIKYCYDHIGDESHAKYSRWLMKNYLPPVKREE